MAALPRKAMAKERKLKTLTYKQAVFHEAGPNLKQVLEKALKEKPTVGQRREALSGGEESPVWRLVGEFVVEKEFVFGVLMRYMPGLNPAFVVDDESLKTLTIKQVAVPQTDDGKRRELLDGMLFFGVFDNHLVLMQSASLRSDHLEHHVQWLLHQSGALIGTNTLRLIDGLPKATRDKLMEHQVREIDLGGALVQ